MQCPLCRESVADDNALQVHYLMSCRGYLENPSAKNPDEVVGPPSKKLVQLRWVKTKPTLAREVYLISSLAGSIKLEWREIEECFLSDQVEIPQGLHMCQLVVDGDSMSTDDFKVSDTSRTIDVLISADAQTEESQENTTNAENHEPEASHTSHPEQKNEQGVMLDGGSETTTQKLPPEGSLYHELIKHQILHGDSLEKLTGGASSDPGESSSHQKGRTRGNGLATRNSQSQSSRKNTVLRDSGTVVAKSKSDGDEPSRSNPQIPDLPTERQRNVVRDSLSEDELQQFLQPTRTRQESNDDRSNENAGTTEERVSSLSDNEEHSVSLSSHEELERRPELLGQSNGENESRVPSDSIKHGVREYGGQVANHEETPLIDLREPSSERERDGSSSNRGQVTVEKGQKESSSDMRQRSSANNHRRLSDETRERPSSSRKQPSLSLRGESSGNGRTPSTDGREPSAKPSIDIRKSSANNHEPSGKSREPSDDNRDGLGGNRTEASSSPRQETASDLEERTSTPDFASSSRQERTSVGRDVELEGESGTKSSRTGGGISETPLNNLHEGALSVSVGDYFSLPTNLSSDHTRIKRSEALVNPHGGTVESGLFSRDTRPRSHYSSLNDRRGLETRDLISPRSSATSSTRDVRKEATDSKSHGVEAQPRDLISPRSSTTFLTSTRVVEKKSTDNKSHGVETQTQDLTSPRSSATSLTSTRVVEKEPTDSKSHGGETQNRDRISPRVSATSLTDTRSVDKETSVTGDSGLEGTTTRTTTDDLLFRNHTGSSVSRTNPVLTRVNIVPSRDSDDSSRENETNREMVTQCTDVGGTRREPNRETGSHDTGSIAQNKETISTHRYTRDASRKESGGSSYPLLTRHSPPGSFMDDSVIRRPPLYTSAPSRSHSSLPFSSHTAISPLSSPQGGEMAVSSSSSLGPSADKNSNETRTTVITSQSILNRRAPTGSTMDREGYQAAVSTPITSSKPTSQENVNELLVSLRNADTSRRNVSPKTSPRDKSSQSEEVALRLKVAERDEAVRKLKAKNASYKEIIEALRKKEIELTKALSSAEASQEVLREQEEISSELTNALGEKEKQCAELEVEVLELKREQLRKEGDFDEQKKNYEEKISHLKRNTTSLNDKTMQEVLKKQEEISRELTNALGEQEKRCSELKAEVLEMKREQLRKERDFDEEKKNYEEKIRHLKRNNTSLEDEVKTLREVSTRTSPKYSDDYKRLYDYYQKSRGISASLKDQVQVLEKENKVLKDKLTIFLPPSRNEKITSYTRDSELLSRLDRTSRQNSPTMKDFKDTNKSPVFVERHQFNGVESHTNTRRQNYDSDRNKPSLRRDPSPDARHPYDGHRSVLQNSRYRSQSADHRTSRSSPVSETTRTQFDTRVDNLRPGHENLGDYRRDPSDVYGTDRYQYSPSANKPRSRESRQRQRHTTADKISSGTSPRDYSNQSFAKRSHSSDAIRNDFPDETRSKVSPNQDRESPERSRRSGSSVYYEGSYDSLNPSQISEELTLIGQRLDHASTPPDSTSPRSPHRSHLSKGSPFAPETPQQIDIGMTVLVSRNRGKLCRGIVRYIGLLPVNKDNVYVGLELSGPDGKHDGKFDGKRFFKCKPNHGIFVLFEKVVMAYM